MIEIVGKQQLPQLAMFTPCPEVELSVRMLVGNSPVSPDPISESTSIIIIAVCVVLSGDISDVSRPA